MFAVAAPGLVSPAWGDGPRWPDRTYDYIVFDQSLRQVLQQFSANLGIRVILARDVQGQVMGPLPAAKPRAFLDHLAAEYGLDWYYDQDALWISPNTDIRTRFLSLGGITLAALVTGLKRDGLYDRHFALREGPAPSVAMVAGPPRYVAIVSQALAALQASANPPAPKPAATVMARRAARGTSVTIIRGGSISTMKLREE